MSTTQITAEQAAAARQFMALTVTGLKNPTVNNHYWALKALTAEAMLEIALRADTRDLYSAADRKAIRGMISEYKANAVADAPVPAADQALAEAKFHGMQMRKEMEAQGLW